MNEPSSDRADALLGALQRERGGQLKVFLGAAPGVGKTYAMLSAAKALRARGIDVVVGIVETHGRSDTAALLDGFETLPRRSVEYRGRQIEEFDLDALLARRPQVALVDELAHSNAPGSRHGRRYQDIEELLDAGIDVYTTVNIQHLESQNDVVHRITGVRVRETVPDAFLDRAGDIVLVDLPPRELIERLGQGKVYVPEMAASALQSFFSPSNLTALRELAVQQVADRVDADLREHLAARGIGPVPIRRRVLVAIDGSDNSEYLVRAARKVAERRQSPWTVAFVDTGVGPARRLAVEQCLALARRLGAETALLRGASVVQELLTWARRHAVSSIVIGRTRERPLARMFNRTLTQQLLQQGAHFELTILNTPAARARSRRRLLARPETRPDVAEYGIGVLGAVVATGLAWIADRYVSLDDLSPIFITAVLVVATRTSMAVAVMTALLCFVTYNFFFLDPRLSFYVARSGAITVLLFLAAALIAGRLATRLRAQVLGLRAANAHAGALQALGRRLAVAGDDGEIVSAALRALRENVDADVVLLQPDPNDAQLRVSAAEPATARLDAVALAAADWSAKHRQPAGRYTDTLQASRWWLQPVVADDKALAVAALRWSEDTERLAPEVEALVGAMLQDVAQALGRVRLGDALESSRLQGETERLRAALLASVSHDLRSPLSAIVGGAESLIAYRDKLSIDDQRQLAEAILSEGQRLDRYIQNLLDMTRLGHGALKLERDWVALEEIVGAAMNRLRKLHPQIPAHATLAADLPLLYVHPALIEQALFNILENAAKFSPAGEAVILDARLDDGGRLRIDIVDRGPGIPEAERSRIFDMFYSVARGDRGAKGTGLGLAICQGMIGAHGGSVEARAGADGSGTTIRITLPLIAPPSGTAQDD